jgi:hypothetical protein
MRNWPTVCPSLTRFSRAGSSFSITGKELMPEQENPDSLLENSGMPDADTLNRQSQPQETGLETADRWESYSLSILSVFFDHS